MPKCFSEKKKKNQTRATHFDDRGRVPFREKNSNCDGRNKVERARKRKAYDLAASTSQRGAQLITHQLSWQQKDQPMSREGECCSSSNNVQLDAAIRRRHSTAPNGLCSRVCVTSKRTKDSPVEDRWQLSDSERRTRRWQDTHTHKKWGPLHYQTKRLNVFASRNKKLSDSGVIPSPPPCSVLVQKGQQLILTCSYFRDLPFHIYPACVCLHSYTRCKRHDGGDEHERKSNVDTHNWHVVRRFCGKSLVLTMGHSFLHIFNRIK